jgi:single-strand DNA-binding protein
MAIKQAEGVLKARKDELARYENDLATNGVNSRRFGAEVERLPGPCSEGGQPSPEPWLHHGDHPSGDLLTSANMSHINEPDQLDGEVIFTPYVMETMNKRPVRAVFSVVTTESYKDAKGDNIVSTEWHNVEARGEIIRDVVMLIKKGTKVSVQGNWIYRSFKGKEGALRVVRHLQLRSFTLQ